MIKQNIAIVVYSHYSRDARVRKYSEALAEKGYCIDVICLKEDFLPKEANINLIIYPFSRIRLSRAWYILEYMLFFIFTFIILSVKSFTKKYRLIHINNMPDFLVFSSMIPKLFGSKVILDMHDPMPELYMSKYRINEDDIMVKWLKYLEKRSMGFADMILTANDNFKTIFLSRKSCTKNKIQVILNCPDPKIFNPELRIMNSELRMKKKNFNLLYMGTIDKRFGLDLVFEAMPKLIKLIPNIKFTIIPKIEGEGEYYNNIKDQISKIKYRNHVVILKPQPLEDIVRQIKMADVGIVLAQDGIFAQNIVPVKLLEFIQMGIPLIATKTKALKTYFGDSQIRYLIKNTSKELITSVLKLHKSKKLRETLASNAKKCMEKYKWDTEKKKYLKLITTLTSTPQDSLH